MRIKLEAKTPVEQRVLDYLEANASETLADKINTGKKTLAGAVLHATGEARKLMAESNSSGCVCVDDDTVFGWIIHFFEEDDIKEEKTRAKAVVVPGAAQKAKAKAPNKAIAQQDAQMDMFSALFAGGAK